MILVDAGPMVALIHASDAQHRRCVDALKELEEPMASVWPAVTEAMYLLGFSFKAQDALWEMLLFNHVVILPIEGGDLPRMRELMQKYRDLPMDLADAALVAVAERERIRRVFTLDRRHFERYRPLRMGHFLLMP